MFTDGLYMILELLDNITDSNRHRHITGGVLISFSLLFGGVAITIMTTKGDD